MANKLSDLKETLVKELKEQNRVISTIKVKHEATIEKRKEVNELMVKSKLITADDLEKLEQQNPDETLGELPPEIEIKQDETIRKLNGVLKHAKKRVKFNKVIKANASMSGSSHHRK